MKYTATTLLVKESNCREYDREINRYDDKAKKKKSKPLRDNSINKEMREHLNDHLPKISRENSILIQKMNANLPPLPPTVPVTKPSTVQLASKTLPHIIKELLDYSAVMQPPQFKFEVNEESAIFNFNLLKSNKFDLGKLLNMPLQSVTSYGSEFKPISQLERLLGRHPRWKALKDRLQHGASFPISSLTEETRKGDMKIARTRGNHKSAEKHATFLADALSKETSKGWNLLLPEEKIEEIPDLEIAPLGVADQLGISANGEFIHKLRITHDLSFPGGISGESINARVDKEKL